MGIHAIELRFAGQMWQSIYTFHLKYFLRKNFFFFHFQNFCRFENWDVPGKLLKLDKNDKVKNFRKRNKKSKF